MAASKTSGTLNPVVIADPGAVLRWGHRNVSSRVSEFVSPVDGRVLRFMFDPHEPEEYYSPRHHHNFDQTRLVTEGRVEFGESLIAGPGDLVYFPAGTRYGITVCSKSATVLTLQTQAPDWAHFPTRAEAARGASELQAKGSMDREKGLFTWKDGRVQDAYEAMWEQLNGRALVYPAPRFAHPCLIHCDAFDWIPAPIPGIARKFLAAFNRIGPFASMIRIERGGSLPAARAMRHEVFGLLDGQAIYGTGRSSSELGYAARIYVPPGARRERLTALRDTTLFVIAFEPRDTVRTGLLAI